MLGPNARQIWRGVVLAQPLQTLAWWRCFLLRFPQPTPNSTVAPRVTNTIVVARARVQSCGVETHLSQ